MRFFTIFFNTLSFCKSFTNSLHTRFLPQDSIVFSISSQPFNSQCNGNILNLYGLTMQVLCSVNGNTFRMPAAETGLPVIDMSWYVNGSPVNVTSLNTFNIDPVSYSGNVWSFGLLDDQPSVGGTVQLGNCVQGQKYSIQASFSTNSFITGMGIPQLNIPAVSGIPTIQNNLLPENIYTNHVTTTSTTTLSPTTTSTTTLSTTTKTTSTTTLSRSTKPTKTTTSTTTLSRSSDITKTTSTTTLSPSTKTLNSASSKNIITTTLLAIEIMMLIFVNIYSS